MNNKKWSEEDVEKTLTKLPPVKDRQTKDDLFRAIESKAETELPTRFSPRKKKPWVFPTMASVAAVLLAILIIPPFFTSDNQLTTDNLSQEEEKMNATTFENNDVNAVNDTEDEAHEGAVHNDAEDKVIEAPEVPPASVENDDNTALAEYDEPAQNMTEPARIATVAYIAKSYSVGEGSSANHYITVEEYELDESVNREKALLTSVKESDTTSGHYLNSLEDVTSTGDTVQLHFTDTTALQALSSQEYTFVEEMFHEIVPLYGYKEVEFLVDEEPGVILGPQGMAESLNVMTYNRGYYLIDENNEVVLISARMAGEEMKEDGNPLTFEQTVEKMATTEDEEDWYESAIPSPVEVTSVTIPGDTARVGYRIAEDADIEEERLHLFFEALKLTAKSFTLDSLEIINVDSGDTVTYNMEDN
ncbi:hypothetical protein MM221_12125 [Salipaludibacillus sp. LMS25]|jgi:hypothetical protein|uniref:hypothetical protein n=1 Tax=Salipaludibacillus sp. LMS25 TaxID=2924031 RepID=UPI0020D086E1|nr:hypothetical protein [Salipaludibacillus sp. LMS25]UTR13390.1 hypothetical protein MM221_12125 [Salipaludibacillus sp. LMS25]